MMKYQKKVIKKVKIPSHTEVLQSFKTLKDYFIADEKTSDFKYTLSNEIENTYGLNWTAKAKQKVITDYFSENVQFDSFLFSIHMGMCVNY